jgi:hypothetical protein
MLIFKEDSRTGVSCGLNDFGELFIGNSRSGYNLPDTPENREKILKDFDCWWTGWTKPILRWPQQGLKGVFYDKRK